MLTIMLTLRIFLFYVIAPAARINIIIILWSSWKIMSIVLFQSVVFVVFTASSTLLRKQNISLI